MPAHDIIDKLYDHYDCVEHTTYLYDQETKDEEKRLTTNTWIDILGIEANKETKIIMKDCINDDVPADDRWYVAQDSKCVLIYFYGRDYLEADMWWVMLRKNKERCLP